MMRGIIIHNRCQPQMEQSRMKNKWIILAVLLGASAVSYASIIIKMS